MRLCAFDLDHTLIRSPLDLAAMAADMRALIEEACGPLPPRGERYRVGELIAYCQRQAPTLEPAVWALALEHERQALAEASLEPGARATISELRAVGFRTALWTNNARPITLEVLDRFGLVDHFDLIVTRDDMSALKPDPAGWRVIVDRFGAITDGVVVGDSWVDGLAAAAAGVPFIAYRANRADLERWKVATVAHLTDLAALPSLLGIDGAARGS